MSARIIAFVAAFACCSLHGAEDAPQSLVRKVETRFHGIHSVYIDEAIPDQGCDLSDRAVVNTVEDPGGLLMVEVAKDALLWNKNIIMRIDGCVPFNRVGATAPRIIRLEIRR